MIFQSGTWLNRAKTEVIKSLFFLLHKKPEEKD